MQIYEVILLVGISAAFVLVLTLLIQGRKQKRLEEALALSRQEKELLARERDELERSYGETLQKYRELQTSHAVITEQLASKVRQVEELMSQVGSLNTELSTKQESLTRALQLTEKESAKAVATEEHLKRLRNELDELKRLHEGKLREFATLQAENSELKARQQEREHHYEEQLRLLVEQKEVLKKEFENLANKIFEDKGRSFTELSKQSLDVLLEPFKQQIKEFRVKVEDIHHKDIQQQVALRTELKQLQALNQKITTEAHELATALRGQKKTQGNWGELILENVLDRSGLQLGKDYQREVSIATEEGRSRPDVIVYLPDDKHLVIDAKVSLNAYTRYVNAEEVIEREQALAEHVAAVASRIKELSDKNYFQLPGLNSPEMVFMFVPIESAFVEALKADETLFQQALERNVLVATPTTLLTSLNIVRQLWRFEDQNKHTAELADKAGKVYDKLNTFLGSMEGVGKALDRAKDSYDKAYAQLYTGRGNLIKQANEFKKLGVSVKADLPQRVVEKAELELKAQQSEPDEQAE